MKAHIRLTGSYSKHSFQTFPSLPNVHYNALLLYYSTMSRKVPLKQEKKCFLQKILGHDQQHQVKNGHKSYTLKTPKRMKRKNVKMLLTIDEEQHVKSNPFGCKAISNICSINLWLTHSILHVRRAVGAKGFYLYSTLHFQTDVHISFVMDQVQHFA